MFLVLAVGALAFLAGYKLIPDTVAIHITRFGTKLLFYPLYVSLAFLLIRKLIALRQFGMKKEIIWLLLISLIGTCFLQTREPYGFKITADEYVISSEAKSIHRNNTSEYSLKSFRIYRAVKPISEIVDKRPPSFPVLLAIVHDLSGFRVANVFVLNAMVTFGFIFMLGYLVSRAVTGDFSSRILLAVHTILIALSLPLLAQNSNGGAGELFNLLMILLSSYLAYLYLKDEREQWLVLWLLVSIVLFYVRYESALFVVAVGIILLLKSVRLKRLAAWPGLLVMPLALVPMLLRNRIFEIFPDGSWQFQGNETAAFSFDYFVENMGHAVLYFFELDLYSSNSFLITYVGFPALLILMVRALLMLMRREPFTVGDTVFLVYGGVVILNFLLLMCYHWGTIDTLEASRLALPFMLLMGAGIVRILLIIVRKRSDYLNAGLCILIAYLVFHTIPSTSSHDYTKRNYEALTEEWAFEKLQTLNDPSAFVITSNPLLWSLYDVPVYHSAQIKENLGNFEFHLANHSFNAYLVQRFRRNPITGEYVFVDSSGIGKAYALETLGTFSYKPYEFAVLSRITGPKDPSDEEFGRIPEKDYEAVQEDEVDYWFEQID